MSLPEHEETFIECLSVKIDEFQKTSFRQLVVKRDCKQQSEINLLDTHVYSHASPHVCSINSVQFLTGFNKKTWNPAKRWKNGQS